MQPRAPLVETERAEVPDAPPTISQTAFLRPYREVDAAFEVQGRIDSVSGDFEVGNTVEEGAVLATIDRERLRANVAQAEADLRAAQASASEAEQAFQRQDELEDRGVAAEATLEEVRAARTTAQAQVDVAAAAVEAARIDLRSAELTAPFDAYVTARSASEGQIVSPGQAIGTLVRADIARLVVGLSDRQAQALDDLSELAGTEVTIRRAGGDGRVLRRGRVVDVDVRIDEATRLTNLLVNVADPFGDAPVRLGELLVVEIPFLTDDPLVAVPSRAVKDGRRVWVVTPEEELASRDVSVALRTDETVYLSDAADLEGARLMTTDLAGASDGMEVRVADGESSPSAGSSGGPEATSEDADRGATTGGDRSVDEEGGRTAPSEDEPASSRTGGLEPGAPTSFGPAGTEG
ncbi:efflux RND transporter periplasmic adaptor subunit [Histidinibacterium aquaticum]|uniref:efflux RND transporter periplasmic adaptor subunit n=1 Tax=Histidinibacterium aquaticum TaxID=2613962 RepID=UPI00168B5A8A|nr:efflux RND transporter periplasmic adaptor subunit [Histidinibacterium aquaticum]